MALSVSMCLNGLFFGVFGTLTIIFAVKTIRDMIQESIKILNKDKKGS